MRGDGGGTRGVSEGESGGWPRLEFGGAGGWRIRREVRGMARCC